MKVTRYKDGGMTISLDEYDSDVKLFKHPHKSSVIKIRLGKITQDGRKISHVTLSATEAATMGNWLLNQAREIQCITESAIEGY